MTWTVFEIILSCLLGLSGAALKILFVRMESAHMRCSSLETQTAVLRESKTNIFHRLEKMDEKLDKILLNNGGANHG